MFLAAKVFEPIPLNDNAENSLAKELFPGYNGFKIFVLGTRKIQSIFLPFVL